MAYEEIVAKPNERLTAAEIWQSAWPDPTGIRAALARNTSPEKIAKIVVSLPAGLQAKFRRDWLDDPPTRTITRIKRRK